ncbi:MAG: DUF4352 domain-containing protein [Catenulispora sp.]|nr:DUF4352 domain-containing protein [Catenulispora sp.]
MDERNDAIRTPYSIPMLPPSRPPKPVVLRRTAILAGIGTFVLGAGIGAASSSSKTTVTTDSHPIVTITSAAPSVAQAAAPSASQPAHSSTSKPQTAAPAKVGGALALSGMRDDEKLSVTLVKFADPATSSDEFMKPDNGKRYVAVQLRITNTATTAYSDSPTNGATLIDASGQQYRLTFADVTLGQSFNGDVRLSPGASALGVMTFEVPTEEKIATFQFTLDSGFADQTGQWQIG